MTETLFRPLSKIDDTPLASAEGFCEQLTLIDIYENIGAVATSITLELAHQTAEQLFEAELNRETTIELPNGESVLVRRMTADDREMFGDLYRRSSTDDLYSRFEVPFNDTNKAADDAIKYSSLEKDNYYDFVALTIRPDSADETWQQQIVATTSVGLGPRVVGTEQHADVAIMVDRSYSKRKQVEELIGIKKKAGRQLAKELAQLVNDGTDGLLQVWGVDNLEDIDGGFEKVAEDISAKSKSIPGLAEHILLRTLTAANLDPGVDVIDFMYFCVNNSMHGLLKDVVADNKDTLQLDMTTTRSYCVFDSALRPIITSAEQAAA